MRDRVGVRVGEFGACVCIRNYAQDGIYNGRIINANEVEGSGKFRFDQDTRCEGEKWNARGEKERERREERERKGGRKKRIKKIFTGPGTDS